MDGKRFDGLARTWATAPGTRRALVAALIAGLVGGGSLAALPHEAAAGGRCKHGRHRCHDGCCPRRAPRCCKHGCCKKGWHCCHGGRKCCRKLKF